MADLIITPSLGKIDFIHQSAQAPRFESIILHEEDGLVFTGKISASSVTAPLNVINVTAGSSNVNYPFIFASSGETGAKSLLMDSAGGTYNPSTNTATIDISGNSATATLASNSTNLGGVGAASYVTLTGTQTLTNKTITGTFTGNLAGTSSWSTNAITATNASTATNATQLNSQAASYYTNIPARLGYTPVNQAGDTVSGNLTVNGNFSVNGSFTAFSASNIYLSSSVLTIEDNILTLNSFSPYLRYAGIEMYDSGSGTLSSLLWDGEGDYFFLTGSTVNGKIITGPDSQANLTANFVPKATAGNKLGNSLIFDNGTNVGIGTTTPSGKLSTGASSGMKLLVYDNAATGVYTGLGQDLAAGNSTDLFAHSVSNLGFITFGKIGTNASTYTEWARFNTSGNLGIGTTVPVARLQVNSTTSGDTLFRTDGTNGTLFSVVDDLSDSLMSVNNSAGLPVLEVFADDRIVAGQYGQNDLVLINNKVGLGTNNPANKLYVSGSVSIGSGTYNISAPTNGLIVEGKVGVGTNSVDGWAQLKVIGTSALGGIVYVTDKIQALSAFPGSATNLQLNTDGGNVGIGTTLPFAKLHVQGNISASSFTSSISNAIGFLGTSSWANNATTVVTNANLTGDVTSTGNATTIASNAVTTVKILDANVTNAKLTNSSLTIGSTAISLGTTASTISGLTSLTSTTVNATTVNSTNVSASATGSFGIVGIGTNSSSYKLDVIGDARVSGGIVNSGLSAQWTLSGGGTVTFNGYITWSNRVIAIPVEKDEFANAGYIDITCPPSGSTITYYNPSNVTTTATCDSNGIPTSAWESLYYEVTPGQIATSDPTKFRLVNYQNSTWRPSSNWLLICTRNGDGNFIKWIPGQVIIPNGGSFDSSNSTNNWQIAGTTNYVPKFTAANKIGNSAIYDSSGNIGIGTTVANGRVESYYASNAITFNYLATNLNVNSPIPIYGFDVTSGAETRSIKAGIGYERHLPNGRGTIHIYNDSVNDTSNLSGNRTTAGDIKMSLDNSGNVGIGTTIPTSLLELSSSTASSLLHLKSSGTWGSSILFISSSGRIGLGTSNPTYGLFIQNYSTTQVGQVYVNAALNSSGKGVVIDSATRTTSDNSVLALEIINNAGTNTLAATVAGNVGIGSSSPGGKLDVSGPIRGDAGANYPHSFTNTDSGNTHWTNRSDRLLTSNGTNWATDGRDPIMALVTSGNSNATTIANSIGLALHNESTTDNTFSPAIAFSNRSNSTSYNTAYATIIGKKTGQGVDSNWSSGELHFYTMPSGAYVQNIPSLLVRSDGVGIGTTSFTYASSNRGNLEIYGSTDAVIGLRNSTANSYIQKLGNDFYLNNGGAGIIYFQNNGSNRVVIDSNGNVGIGTTIPGQKLDVEGRIRTRGATGTGGFEIGAATTGTAKWRIEWDSASDSLDFNWVG